MGQFYLVRLFVLFVSTRSTTREYFGIDDMINVTCAAIFTHILTFSLLRLFLLALLNIARN